MSQSSTFSKHKDKNESSQKQLQNQIVTIPSSALPLPEEETLEHTTTPPRTILAADHQQMQQPRQENNSFGAFETSLPTLSDGNEDDDESEAPKLMQFFASRRKQHATWTTMKASNHLRSDVSAITLDTALEPAILIAAEEGEVPLLLKDMTTVFSPLRVPPFTTATQANNHDAVRMRRASLSAAIPALPVQQQGQRQPRRASVAGGEPSCHLDSSLSNARQPIRLVEYPPPSSNSNNTQSLIMPQRRSSSPRPPTVLSPTTNNNNHKTLLPFVGLRPIRRKPDPQARTPTDRDQNIRFLATYLDQTKKLEPTGRTATGGSSTRFPETNSSQCPQEDEYTLPNLPTSSPVSSKKPLSSSIQPVSPASSSKKSLSASSPPVSPCSSSKKSPSSLDKAGSTHEDANHNDKAQKRSRTLRPKSTSKTSLTCSQRNMSSTTTAAASGSEPNEPMSNASEKPLSSKATTVKRSNVPSPRRIGTTDNTNNDNNGTPSSPEQTGPATNNGMKKQASARKVRPAEVNSITSRPISTGHDVDIVSSSPLGKAQSGVSKQQNKEAVPNSPRRMRTGLRNAPIGDTVMKRAKSEPSMEKDSMPSHRNNRNTSSPVRSPPRKNRNRPTQQPLSSKTATTTDFTESSPQSVKKRIRSPQGTRNGRSASLSHLTALATPLLSSSSHASSRIIKESHAVETNAQRTPLNMNGTLDSDRNNSGGSVDICMENPNRSSLTTTVASTDPSKNGKHENGGRNSPVRRKQRASSMSHAPIVRKSVVAANAQQSEHASSIGLPRMSGSKANKSEGTASTSPNKALSSPRRRRRRVASMQLVSAKMLNGDDIIKTSELKPKPAPVSRGRRAMSMQHVSIPVGADGVEAAKQSIRPVFVNSDSHEVSVKRTSEPRIQRWRRCASSDFTPDTGYDSAPESERKPRGDDAVPLNSKPRHPRSRSTGFNSDLIINDLTSFAKAESKFEAAKGSGTKSKDFIGIATALFRKGEKKSVLGCLDESSVSYVRAGSLLQERYRSGPS